MSLSFKLAVMLVVLSIRIKQLFGRFKVRRRFESLPINRMEYRVFSQHREDGIIDYLLESMGIDTGTFV